MTPNEIADEIQGQLLSAAEVVQDRVVTTIEWVGEKAETILPQTSARLANRLPLATKYLDRGFETAEQWLRTQHQAVPQTTARLAGRLPQATQYVDRGFDTAEQILRSQREFASKIATALTPTA